MPKIIIEIDSNDLEKTTNVAALLTLAKANTVDFVKEFSQFNSLVESLDTPESKAEVVKPAETPESKAEVLETPESKADEPETDQPSMEDLKQAMRKAKKSHGEPFINTCFETAGVKIMSTIGRTAAKATPDQYSEIIELLNNGPVKSAPAETPETEDDDFELDVDDGFDSDDEPENEDIDPETVRLALNAYASENGRDKARLILKEFKIPSLKSLDKMTQSKLKKITERLAQ